MPTVIDSFVVTLGFDPAALKAGKGLVKTGLREVEDEANRTQKALDNAFKKGADKATLTKLGGDARKAAADLKAVRGASGDTAAGFTELATRVGVFLAALGGGAKIKQFIEDTIASSAALSILSKNLATNAGEIAAWSNAVEVAGGTAGDLQGTFSMLKKAQTDLLLTGESAMVPLFSNLGVAMFDAKGKARGVADQLLDLAGKFEGMPRDTAFNLGQMYGINPGTMNLLLKGRAEVERLISKQKEYAAQQAKFAPVAERLNAIMTEARQGWNLLGLELVAKVAPAVEWVADAFKSAAKWIQDNQGFVEGFIAVVAVALTAKLAPALAVAAARMWLFLAPIIAAAAPVLILAAAIGLLWDDLNKFLDDGEGASFFNWAPAIKLAGEAVTWLHGLLDSFIYRIIAAGDAWDALKKGDMKRLKFAAGEFINGRGDASAAAPGAAPTATGKPTAKPTAPGAKRDVIAEGFANYQSAQKDAGVKPGTPSTADQVISFYMGKGWTREQATGIAANLKQESNFDPAAVGDGGKAYGIGQWHPNRQADFKKQYGKEMQGSSLNEQLEFLQWEMLNTEKAGGDKLRKTNSAQDAAEAVSRYIERPGATPEARDMEAARRRSIAASMGGIPGAAAAAQGAGATAATQRAGGGSVSKQVDTSIGAVNVYTQATDAKGIARDIGQAMDFTFTAQANGAVF